MHDPDRPRGILTPRDRRFLAGTLDEELSNNSERQKRYQLRERFFHALQDLRYLGLMETRDLGQIAESAQLDKDNDGPKRVPPEQERILHSAREFLSFLRETYGPEMFYRLIEDELEIQAKLDHYEETGDYGEFNVELSVTQTDTIPIKDLLEMPIGQRPPEPGVSQVVQLHLSQTPGYDGVTESSYEPEHPELMETVTDAIEEHDSGTGADQEQVIETVMERHDVGEDTVKEAIKDALFSGFTYKLDEETLGQI